MLPRQIKQGEGVMGDAVLERKVSEGVWKGGDIREDTDEKIGSSADLCGESIPGRGDGACPGLRQGRAWCVHGPVRAAVGLEGRDPRGERKGKRAKGGQSPAHGGSSGPR